MNTNRNSAIIGLILLTVVASAFTAMAEYRDIKGSKRIVDKDGSMRRTQHWMRVHVSSYSNLVIKAKSLSDPARAGYTNGTISILPQRAKMSLNMVNADISNGVPTLLTLANSSDMIVIGTVEHLLTTPDYEPFYIDNEAISRIFVVKVNEVVASVAAVSNSIRTSHGCSNILYILEHPLVHVSATSDDAKYMYQPPRPLTCGGEYLFWLGAYPMSVEGSEVYDLEPECMFKTLMSGIGSVLLSDVYELPLVKYAPERAYIYDNNPSIMRATYNTTNTTEIIKAIRNMAKLMQAGDDNANTRDAFISSLGISISNNIDDLHWGRYHTVEKKLK